MAKKRTDEKPAPAPAKRAARPKLQVITGNDAEASRLASIPRSAQPGDVPLPRAVMYRTDLRLSSRMVAAWLYDHCEPGTHIATGAQTTIAADLGIDKKTVLTALDELWRAHVMMSIERRPKKGGGYYLAYGLRVYPLGEPRRQRRPRLKAVRSAKPGPPSPKAVASSRPAPPATCPRCHGSGWERNEIVNAARRCPDCRP